jgi:hypothetical protein
MVEGPWIDKANGTCDATAKPKVEGQVQWDGNASMTLSADGQTRTISTNALPDTSGVFAITTGSEASKYDTNPNRLAAQNLSITLPINPVPYATSIPLNPGTIGFLYSDADKDELIPLFNPVDERENDAVAHEMQDSNNGHPEATGTYHFHSLPEAMKNAEGVIGCARDGFEISGSVGNGEQITKADLDENHGQVHDQRQW